MLKINNLHVKLEDEEISHDANSKGEPLLKQILINYLFLFIPTCAFYYYDVMDNKMSFFKSKQIAKLLKE